MVRTDTYDDAGNTLTRTTDGDTQTLEWDAEGRLQTVTRDDATDEYVYTADGDRLLRRQGASTTLYLPGGQELTLTGTTTSAIRSYTFAGMTIASRNGIGTANLTTQISDHHGTPLVAINNSTNTAIRRYQDPFGIDRGAMPTVWPHENGFLNKPKDTTGLTHIGARYYDPQAGQFISPDPIIDVFWPQQIHPYNYANANPVTISDPTGLYPKRAAWSPARESFEPRKHTITPARSGNKAAKPSLKRDAPEISSAKAANEPQKTSQMSGRAESAVVLPVGATVAVVVALIFILFFVLTSGNPVAIPTLPPFRLPETRPGNDDTPARTVGTLAKPRNVPFPDPNARRAGLWADRPHMVYVINYQIGDLEPEVWKYGITGVQPFSARPNSQIPSCEARSGGECTWEPVEYTVGWFPARFKEATLIQEYANEHDGLCPPGQRVSCM